MQRRELQGEDLLKITRQEAQKKKKSREATKLRSNEPPAVVLTE